MSSWPDSPAVRATVLAPWLTGSRVAVRLTAAWIWEAAEALGDPLSFALLHRGRGAREGGEGVRLQQFRWYDGDLTRAAGYLCTTPLRTAYDLLRFGESFSGDEADACRALVRMIPGSTEALAERIRAGGPMMRHGALERLLEL